MADDAPAPVDPGDVGPVNAPYRGTVRYHQAGDTGYTPPPPVDPGDVQPVLASGASHGGEDLTPPRTPMEETIHRGNLLKSSAVDSVLETLGIPGSIGQSVMQGEKAPKNVAEATQDVPDEAKGDVALSYLLYKGLSHLPSGSQAKDFFWNKLHDVIQNDIGPAKYIPGMSGIAALAGSKHVEPQTPGEQIVSEATKAAIPLPTTKLALGARLLSGLSGAAGELAAQLSPNHPDVARFVTSLGTMLTGGAVTKTAQVGRNLIREASPAGQEALAARGLLTASGETDPNALAASIRRGGSELVPGSQPTTAQAANNINLTDTLSAQREGNPALTRQVAEREAEQNAARWAQANAVSPGGDAGDTRQFFQSIQDRAKSHIDQVEQEASQEVGRRVQALGPGYSPQQTGQVIRSVAEEGLDRMRQAVSRAYTNVLGPGRSSQIAIDPGPAMRRIDYQMRQRFGPKNPAPGLLTDLVEAIRNDGQGLSYKDMNDLVTRAGDTITRLADSKNAQATAIKIKQILLDRMDASASETAKVLPYTQNADQEARTIRERLTRLNELLDINKQQPLKRWAASRQDLEDQIKALEGKVRADFGIQGNLNPQEWARYQYARQLRTEMAERYEQGPVSSVVQRGSSAGGHLLSDSEVPAAFFHKNASAPDDIRQFEDVMGGHPNAMASLREYAIGHLQATADRAGGMTPQLLHKWMADHAAALRPFPELRQQLQGIRDAQDLAAAAGQGMREDLEKFQQTAARHFLSPNPNAPVDPAVAINNALKTTNRMGRTDIQQLVAMASRDQSGDAMEGLRRGIMEHIARVTSGVPDLHGTPLIMNQKFNAWMRANRDKIAPAFTTAHMQALDQIAADLQRGTLGRGTAGGANLTIGQAMQAALGGYHSLIPNIPVVGKKIMGFLYGRTDAEIADAFNRMLLDPKLAAAALDRIGSPTAQRSVALMLRRAGTAQAVRDVAHASGSAPNQPANAGASQDGQ